MKKKNLLTTLMALISLALFSQDRMTTSEITIQAQLIDQQTKLPISYANIGFIDKGIGTISDDNGDFELTYDEHRIGKNELFQISTLGYKTRKFEIMELYQLLSKTNVIYLNPEPLALGEVILTKEKRKELRLGSYHNNERVVGYWKDKLGLGGEIATKVKVRKPDTRILDLKFNVVRKSSDSLKIRVNVYDYDKKKRRPSEKILTQNMFHTISKKGDVHIDLRDYDITVHDDFIVSIELIEVFGDQIDFAVSGEAYGGISFKRRASQDKWERFPYIGMNFSVLTSVSTKSKKALEKLVKEEQEEELFITEAVKKRLKPTNTIYGKITHLGQPLDDVNIRIKGTTLGTKTASDGTYTLKAQVGEEIEYSHIGMHTVSIITEDITRELNLELFEKNNVLKEAVVNATKPEKQLLNRAQKAEQPFFSSTGIIDPKKSNYSIAYIDGSELNMAAAVTAGFTFALDGKVAGLRVDPRSGHAVIRRRFGPVIWDVDGMIFTQPPNFIDPGAVQTVHVLSFAGPKYGPLGRHGVIVVNTMKPQVTKKLYDDKLLNKEFYQNDAVKITNQEVFSKPEVEAIENIIDHSKTIFGVVKTNDIPLADVNIRILDSPKGTKTSKDGNYTLETKIGDELEFSFVGMHKVTVVVEDVTEEINIDMVPKTNSLDQVVVTAKNIKGEVLKRAEAAESSFETTRGTFDPKRVGYAIGYIDGDEVNKIVYPNLREMLRGKLSGIQILPYQGQERVFLRGTQVFGGGPAAWEVDGVFTEEEPSGLDTNQISSIRLLRGLAATNKYGTLGKGGVIVIKTTLTEYDVKNSKNAVSALANNNFYQNDAVQNNANAYDINESILTLETYDNRAHAFKFYQEQLMKNINNFEDHIDIAKFFLVHFKDQAKATKVLVAQAKMHKKDPEILKALAYHLQAIGNDREAIKLYQKVLSLRTDYAQSYRDLANAYKSGEKYEDAWRYYINYLLEGHDAQGEGIAETVYNEMEYLHFNRPNQTKFTQTFTPRKKDKVEFRNDIRFVVEWNTSEAEFDLEFVSPDMRSYVFEHTLIANQELINFEKRKGFSSKEFFIDEMGTGEWLVNLTYYGNKKSTPTYIKLTTYYNWGKPLQREEIQVFKLEEKNQKFQLLKINEQSLVVSN